jgi:hypothetical protein
MDFARTTGTLERLEYIDAPPLRLLGDVRKGNQDHSSTAVGKIQLLVTKGMAPRPSFKTVLAQASFL